MTKQASNTKPRKTTVTLCVVFVLLAFSFLAVFFIYPNLRKKYVENREYDIYGGMTEDLKDSELFSDMQSGKSFCFLGDSITAGYTTEGIPWYQPLVPYIKGRISNLSTAGWMVKNLINHKKEIPEADIYVVAIGINDILFPESEYASLGPDDFADRFSRLASVIQEISPDAKIYFISPWTFIDTGEEYVERGNSYRKALSEWCGKTSFRYIDPDPVIMSVLSEGDPYKYLYNNFHPNAPAGIGLYSYAVLKASSQQTKSGL